MDKKTEKIAILIDGDNAQAKLLKPILEETAKYGKITIRRIYGDWTSTHMNSWKDLLNELSFTPIQKFSYTTGKNSTDSALIIDAMDILYSGVVDGFCIVSSDSDYTGLAKRVREAGVFVMGVGEQKTPKAFVSSCEVFTYYENIIQEEVLAVATVSKQSSTKAAKKTYPKVDTELVDKAYYMSAREDTEIYVAALGGNLRKIDPSFDPRAYGFYSLTKLLEKLPQYDVSTVKIGGFDQHVVKRSPPTP
jgi:uncharacterized LabA/DUF88 family protein